MSGLTGAGWWSINHSGDRRSGGGGSGGGGWSPGNSWREGGCNPGPVGLRDGLQICRELIHPIKHCLLPFRDRFYTI